MKMVSIMGDSISTYAGYNPPGYEVFYDWWMQMRNGLSDVSDTWWAQVIRRLDGQLCVNNSYSGSLVTGNGFPAASCEERIRNLRTDAAEPDLILLYIGFNDYGNAVKVRSMRPAWGQPGRNRMIFLDAYLSMLRGMKEAYPGAKVVCGTIMRSRIRDEEDWTFPESYAGSYLEDFNEAIREAADQAGCYVADVGSMDARYETLDGAHPTKEGHRQIAEAWISQLELIGINRN